MAILQALKRICIEDDEETIIIIVEIILANSQWGTVLEPGTTGYTNPTSWPLSATYVRSLFKKETAKHVKLVLELMSWVFTMHYKGFFEIPCWRIKICLTCTCIIISL